jgi:hypothetical protein
VRARRVVGVDQRGLEVPVAEPLLKGPKRDAGGGAVGAEGVAKVVEAQAPEASTGQRPVEALAEL